METHLASPLAQAATGPWTPRRAVARAKPMVRISLGVHPQCVQEQQPDDKEKGAPGSASEKTASGREQWNRDEDRPSHPLEALGEIEIFHKSEVLVPTHLPEHGGANENALIAVIVAGEAIPDSIDPRDRAEAPPSLRKAMLKGAAGNGIVGEGLLDQCEGVRRGERIGVQEKEDFAQRGRCSGIHESGSCGARRPQESRATSHGAYCSVRIAAGRNDDLGPVNLFQGLKVVKRTTEGVGVGPCRNNDGKSRAIVSCTRWNCEVSQFHQSTRRLCASEPYFTSSIVV